MNFVAAFSPEFSSNLALLVRLGLATKDEMSIPSGRVVPYEYLTRLVDMLPQSEEERAADFGARRVELLGERNGREVRLVYDCMSGPHPRWRGGSALGTGVPASLRAQWLARRSVKARGVLPPSCASSSNDSSTSLVVVREIQTCEDDGVKRRQI